MEYQYPKENVNPFWNSANVEIPSTSEVVCIFCSFMFKEEKLGDHILTCPRRPPPYQPPFTRPELFSNLDPFAPSAPSFTEEEVRKIQEDQERAKQEQQSLEQQRLLEEQRILAEKKKEEESRQEQQKLELFRKYREEEEEKKRKKEEKKKEQEEEIRKMLELQKQAASKFLLADEDEDVVHPRKETKKNEVPCPICSKLFDTNKIEDHVNTCLDEPNKSSPKSLPKSPQPKSPQPKSPEKPQADYVQIQDDYYKFLQQKGAQEEQDRLLALKLMNESAPSVPKIVQNSPDRRVFVEDEDAKFALALQKQEEEEFQKAKKLKEDADLKLAKDLEQKDKEIIEAQKKKKEWDEAVNLIKQETRLENDEMLAKLLKEKEDLLGELQQAKDLVKVEEDSSVSLSLDGIEYPKYWQKSVSDFQTFDVQPGTEEYKKVASEFLKGMGGHTIKRIERNQNRTQWMGYFLRRQLVAGNNKMNPNELFLFHGSRSDAYDIILKDGMDHRVANLSGAFGAGIYFAPSSGTSSGYISGTKNGNYRMLYCRVTLGAVGPGSAGLRRPPEMKKGGRLFDSVGNATMYVIFDNHQCYPEYCIYYK